ncbi:hypothetical protein [Dactylosporangium sp. CA-092794]|uniref:hypothetical protein n=1 Tax=Dactylosporangium sp. CA-092794 TaxID=3239929 RepID=UPI003D89ED6A
MRPRPGRRHPACRLHRNHRTALRPNLLDLYRLRWDLTEIAACLARFRRPHGTTADDNESWTILKELVTLTAN